MSRHAIALAPALLGLALTSTPAPAQDHAHHSMPQQEASEQDHSHHHEPAVLPDRPAKPEADRAATPAPASPQPAAVEAAKPAVQSAHSHVPSGHGEHVGHAEPDQARPAGQGGTAADSKVDQSPISHSGMDHSGMDHSGMDHAAMKHDRPPPTGLPVPAVTDADRDAAFPDIRVHTTHDQRVVSFVQFNRFEGWNDEGEGGQAWEGHAWVGTDHHKLWLRSEGERESGRTEAADLEVLYGRPIAPWWDLVAGLRHDFQPGGSQTFAAIGVMGLAPYKFEVEATAYLGESGQAAARVEAEYETLITNRLILQWLAEAAFHGRDDERRGIGSGLGTLEAGLRLRYEFTRKFAPYVGVAWERAYGRTAELQLEDGGHVEDTRLVAGVRFWF